MRLIYRDVLTRILYGWPRRAPAHACGCGCDACGATRDAGRFEEGKHPRGQPENKGEFAPKAGAGAAAKSVVKPAVSAKAKARIAPGRAAAARALLSRLPSRPSQGAGPAAGARAAARPRLRVPAHVKAKAGALGHAAPARGGEVGPQGQVGEGAQTAAVRSDIPASPAKSARASAAAKAGVKPGMGDVRLAPTDERAWMGERRETTTQLAKFESGRIGENIMLAHMRLAGFPNAAALNNRHANFALDMKAGDYGIECKTGLVGNNRKNYHWRVTIGEPSPNEKTWLAAADPLEKAKWNKNKMQAAHDRKRKALEVLSAEAGRPMQARTVAVILDPDRRIADVYEFEGYHDRIGWNSAEAKAAHRASYHYE